MDDRIEEHKRLQINYTSYDLQRKYDSINPTSITSDVMVLSKEPDRSSYPFWYARVLGIYHVDAWLETVLPLRPTRVEFLWVRWLGRDRKEDFGDEACRLERIRFVTAADGSPPFGFLDPASVVRAAHLIPAFKYGRTKQLLRPSRLARVHDPDTVDDWESFYVNR